MKYLLDTHAWIWWNMQSDKLSSKARAAIEQASHTELLLSAISPWEFCKWLENAQPAPDTLDAANSPQIDNLTATLS